jgi:cell division protein FtsL
VARVNVLLLALLVASAIGVVTSQHRSRKAFGELEAEQQAAVKLATEFTQLQLEQGTWATHARVEQAAARRGMRAPDASNTVVIQFDEAAR